MAAEDDNDMPEMSEEDRNRLADTNMENYGGKAHRAKQKALADSQKEWDGVGQEVGTQVWRIEKFRVKHVDVNDYGTFYDGDSYIILHTYTEGDSDAKLHNVHFWLGKDTSQDEAGTAAIKTVELDDKLGDLPVQYREVQGHETKKFKQVFPTMNIMSGGVDSGFNHVEPEEYTPRLIHIQGKKKKVTSTEVPISMDSLNNSDCFILDLGTRLLQFRPPNASMWEKRGCNEKATEIASTRSGKVTSKPIIEWDDTGDLADEFWNYFGGKPGELPETNVYAQKAKETEAMFDNHVNELYHVTDEGGKLKVDRKQQGVLDRGILNDENDDVLVVDVGRVIFVWIGATANQNEIRNGMVNAQKYLYQSGRPTWVPIQRVCSGQEPANFWKAFGCERVPKDIV